MGSVSIILKVARGSRGFEKEEEKQFLLKKIWGDKCSARRLDLEW